MLYPHNIIYADKFRAKRKPRDAKALQWKILENAVWRDIIA